MKEMLHFCFIVIPFLDWYIIHRAVFVRFYHNRKLLSISITGIMFKGSDTKKEDAYANKSTTIEPFNDIIR